MENAQSIKWREVCKQIAKLEGWQFVEHAGIDQVAERCNGCDEAACRSISSACARCRSQCEDFLEYGLSHYYICYFRKSKHFLQGFNTDGIEAEDGRCEQNSNFYKYFISPKQLAKAYFCDNYKVHSISELKMVLAIEGREIKYLDRGEKDEVE